MKEMHSLFLPAGKISLITGAARGIGLGMARTLAGSELVLIVDGGWISA
jgi:NAD(P)-dependent dehydrogenase (short-subunit alcohol dehydrogenase family)